MQCRWGIGYQYFLEDSSDDPKYPQQNNWLPNNILHPQEYSWSPRLGEMVFVDQPWTNPSPPHHLEVNVILWAIKLKMIVMWFSVELPGPNDLEKLLFEATHDNQIQPVGI